MNKIDTHQHLLYPDEFTYSWANDFPALQGHFAIDDYKKAAQACEVAQTLFMEVDVDPGLHLQEAHFFAERSLDADSGIAGIVAKCLPESDGFEREIESIQSPTLKGIRRVLHTQTDELSQSQTFRSNVATLAKHDLSFDLCVTQKQLSLARELALACPEVRFILDHCGIPSIAEHDSTQCDSWKEWNSGIRALSELPNVACKFSGITAYASTEQRTADGLRPYLSEILEAFGAGRIVWGGDWPVCNLADGLHAWSQLTDSLVAELSGDEQNKILSGNARTIYKL